MSQQYLPDYQKVIRRVGALETERSTWWSHWKDIQQVLLPRSGRFFISDVNKGYVKNDILDDSGTAALTILAAGMQSGMTNPSQPWVRFETQDEDLMNDAEVSRWLDQATRTVLNIFARSNFYRVVHGMYEEMGAFGTAATIVLPDFETVAHFNALTIGEYCLAANDKNEIDTLSRSFQWTVGQIVKSFVAPTGQQRARSGTWDWSRCSPLIKNMWDAHNEDAWIPLYQLIEPRLDFNARKMDRKNMPWRSVYVEQGGNGRTEGDDCLYESGFRRFPVLAPRWQTTGNDIYGSTCPGMRALGGIKQLQFEHLRKGQAIDFETNPPLVVPASLKNQDSDFLPGGITYADPAAGAGGKVESAFNVNLRLDHLLLDIQDQREIIKRAFFADVFMAMQSRVTGSPITARQVEEEHQEKMLMLGPVVERTHTELLAPAADITFDYAMQAGILPPPPQQLARQELKLEFVSVLASAQRATAMAGVDRLIAATASIAAAKNDPSAWDNVDTDKAIQKSRIYLGVDPEIARGESDVAKIREAREAAQQRIAQAAQAEQAANTAKTLSEANTGGDNALTQVVSGFSQ